MKLCDNYFLTIDGNMISIILPSLVLLSVTVQWAFNTKTLSTL